MGRKKRGRGVCDNASSARSQSQAQAPTLLDNLKQLREVRDKGLITECQYEAANRQMVEAFATGLGGNVEPGSADGLQQVAPRAPRSPFAFTNDQLGPNGMPDVKAAKSTKRGGFEPQQAISMALLYGGFAEELKACCGPSVDAEAARREFFYRYRMVVLQCIPDANPASIGKMFKYWHLRPDAGADANGHPQWRVSDNSGLQAFRSLMYDGLWKSRVLHELVDQGDPCVVALVDEFKRLNAMHQLAIKAPPAQLAIEPSRVVLDTHTNSLCLEGTLAPMAIEWPQEDLGPPGDGKCGGGSGLANQTGQTEIFGNFGGVDHVDIDVGGGHVDFDIGGDHVDLDGGGGQLDYVPPGVCGPGDVVNPKAVGGQLPSVQECIDGCHVQHGWRALKLGCSIDVRGEIRLTDKFFDALDCLDERQSQREKSMRRKARLDRKYAVQLRMLNSDVIGHCINLQGLYGSKTQTSAQGNKVHNDLLPDLRKELTFISGAAGQRARFIIQLAEGDAELVTRATDMTNKDFRVVITLQFMALLNKAPKSFRNSFLDELGRITLGGLVDDLSAYNCDYMTKARAKELVKDQPHLVSCSQVLDMVHALLDPTDGMESTSDEDGVGCRGQVLRSYYTVLVTGLRPRGLMSTLRQAQTNPTVTFREATEADYMVIYDQMAKSVGWAPNTYATMSTNFRLLYCEDSDKPTAIAKRIIPIRRSWLPGSVASGQFSLVRWLLATLHFWNGWSDSMSRANAFLFRGQTFNNTRLMHQHFFSRGCKFPSVHKHRKSIVRSIATSIHIAAFYDGIPRPGPPYMNSTWLVTTTRLVNAANVALQHQTINATWYYIWCVIDGIGMRHWFPGPIPPIAGGGPVGPFPSPF